MANPAAFTLAQAAHQLAVLGPRSFGFRAENPDLPPDAASQNALRCRNQHTCRGDTRRAGLLKRHLHQLHGFPLGFRQRILLHDTCLQDAEKLDSTMDLQIVLLDFAEDSHQDVEDLVASAREGSLSKVRSMLLQPQDPDLHSSQGYTALMAAFDGGQVEIVRLLLEAGADRDVADTVGCTAVMVASDAGHVDIVGLLLKAGTNKDVVDNHGRPALTRASSRRHAEIVNVLLQAGADKDLANSSGRTALMEALLLEACSDKDVVDNSRRTSLMMASDTLRAANYGWLAWGELAVVAPTRAQAAELEQEFRAGMDHAKVESLLLQAGTNKDAADNSGGTALMKASFRRHIEVVNVLLDAHADKDVADFNDRTALMMASAAMTPAQIRMPQTTAAALMIAASGRRAEIVNMLLQARADKDLGDNGGRTALMMASAAGYVEVISLLLQAGSDKDVATDKGGTALMMAVDAGDPDAVRLLSAV
ncbi:ANKRD50, partial [Symbiodinium sp. KB8]